MKVFLFKGAHMAKPFKDLTEQVDILISRNLVVSDRSKAEDYLHRNNYYNVVNIYGKLFYMSNHSEIFVNGTTLEEITAASFFEHEIKGALFKGVVSCEMKLKSIISYQFDLKYNTIDNYLDKSNYDTDPNMKYLLDRFVDEVNDLLNKYMYIGSDNAIKHYLKVHGSVPFWVLINFLDFGKIETLYRILKPVDQQIVADKISEGLLNEFGIVEILSKPDIESYISSIRQLRNILAHNGKLIGFKARTSVPYSLQLHGTFGLNPNTQRQDVFNIMIILIPFLSYDQYAVLYNTILKRSKQIKQRISSIRIESVLVKLGFPTDFHKYNKINQTNACYTQPAPLFIK
jgi:abortive infection bacteriophage resistance protein